MRSTGHSSFFGHVFYAVVHRTTNRWLKHLDYAALHEQNMNNLKLDPSAPYLFVAVHVRMCP